MLYRSGMVPGPGDATRIMLWSDSLKIVIFVKGWETFVESFEINNFVDSIGSGVAFFSYFIFLHFIKNLSIDEKLLLSHLSAALHSQTFANRKIVTKEKFFKAIKTLTS